MKRKIISGKGCDSAFKIIKDYKCWLLFASLSSASPPKYFHVFLSQYLMMSLSGNIVKRTFMWNVKEKKGKGNNPGCVWVSYCIQNGTGESSATGPSGEEQEQTQVQALFLPLLSRIALGKILPWFYTLPSSAMKRQSQDWRRGGFMMITLDKAHAVLITMPGT